VIPGRTLVTGANGRLGRRLLRHLASQGGGVPRALVRSRFAADALADLAPSPPIEVWTADYANAQALADAVAGCTRIAHLAGILKETSRSLYVDAHERATRALAGAAAEAGVRRIVYLSILGASPDSRNACLASKGRAERILREGKVPSTVLRVPMVLGPGELAAEALRAQASAPFTFLVRGGASFEQPLDADDLMRAVLAALGDGSDAHYAYDLAGPESLARAELLARAAARLGKSPRVVPIPRWLASGLAALVERLPEPPLTRAMLGVLEHDDRIDPGPACRALGVELTPLAETLRRSLEVPRDR
jgi:NADH dehydrogenase